jgi:hypothetical protein
MLAKQESRWGCSPRRPSGYVCLAADNPEDTPQLLDFQSLFLARRLGLTQPRARAVAELAFTTAGGR